MTGLLLLMGCAEPEADAPRFKVSEIDPPDGGEMLIAVSPVLVRFSEPPDMELCTNQTMRLDAIREDATVAFEVPLEFDATGDGFVRFIHAEPLPAGWAYAVTIRGGDTGCADESGTPIVPFFSSFEVP